MTIDHADLALKIKCRRTAHDPTLCDLSRCPVCTAKVAKIRSILKSDPLRRRHRRKPVSTAHDTRFDSLAGTLHSRKHYRMPWTQIDGM